MIRDANTDCDNDIAAFRKECIDELQYYLEELNDATHLPAGTKFKCYKDGLGNRNWVIDNPKLHFDVEFDEAWAKKHLRDFEKLTPIVKAPKKKGTVK